MSSIAVSPRRQEPSSRVRAIVADRRQPTYELRLRRPRPAFLELELWQLKAPVTPALAAPRRIGGLRGRNLELIEVRVVKLLHRAGIDVRGMVNGSEQRHLIAEDLALKLGLLFRVLAPMRQRDNIVACADGLDRMSYEELSYWLGMALHRRNPRRVLHALRLLLTDPKR